MTADIRTREAELLASIQLREVAVTPVADDVEADELREVEGIGVPFGEVYDAGWFREQFAADCEFDDVERALLLYRHGEVIGRLVRSEVTDAGLRVVLRISRTARGDEAWQLVRDGVLDRFSIGFQPLEYLTNEGDDLVTHTRVRVREFSLVPFPAYEGAVLDEHRHNQPPAPPNRTATPEETMTDTLTRAEFDAALVDQRREFETIVARLGDSPLDAPVGAQWRSAGEFLKAIAAGDQEAHEFHRAFTGGTFANSATHSTWLADAIKLIDQRRPQLNAFTREVLPPEGLTLEYLRLKADTTAVAEQLAEGDDLTFGKVELEAASVPVKTYGGYTSLSIQAINRATPVYLSTALKAMDLQFAKVTESAFKTYLATLITAQKTAGNKLGPVASLGAMTVFTWLDQIVDAYELAETRGFQVEGLKVSKDVFKSLYNLKDSTNAPLMQISRAGREGVVGTLRASELTADLADVTVTMITGAAARTAAFYDSVAVTTWEQPGAPVQLQDGNVINLTEQFSKYGSLAIGSQFPTALIPLDITAV